MSHQPKQTHSIPKMLEVALQHHQSSQLPQAEKIYQEILRIKPDESDALHFLGVLNSQRGKFEDAIKLIKKAIEIDPNVPDYYNNLGLALHNKGDYEAAIEVLNKVLEFKPDYLEAYFNLGNAHISLAKTRHDVDEVDEDRDVQNILKTDQEQDGDAQEQEEIPDSEVQFVKEQLEQAEFAFRKILEKHPKDLNTLNNLGNVLRQLDKVEESIEIFEIALSLKPDIPEIIYNYAVTLKKDRQYDAAIDSLNKVARLMPGHPQTYINLGNAQLGKKQYSEAIKAYELATKAKPDYTKAYINLSRVLIHQGQFEDTQSVLNKILILEPDNIYASNRIIQTRKYKETDHEDIKRIERLLDDSITKNDQINMRFSLGKAYKDCNAFDKAYENFQIGNQLKRCSLDYDTKKNQQNTSNLISVFNEDFFKSSQIKGDQSELPVFIVGMPRSGTTLTEQIIASHPAVTGAGELNYIPKVVKELPEKLQTELSFPECIKLLDQKTSNEITVGYLEYLREYSNDSLRITDKMPHNFLNLGLVAMLFPKAHIIHCKRDPMDTCLSVYMHSFAGHHPYSYDLKELGEYYLQYERLMAHWKSVLPIPIYEANYEDLVEEQEEKSRALIEFIGLDWDDQCLQFHKTERAVHTASLWQVRQPIYKSSQKQWKKYEKFLGPLKESLGYSE